MKKLYDYQAIALKKVMQAIIAIGKALMVMAPGLGKTVVAAFFLKKVHKRGQKILFLCHDNYILEQAHDEFKKTFDPKNKLTFYNFFGNRKKVHQAENADVVFGSFQSFNNNKSKWYLDFEKNHFDIIIVDEGHHVQAPTFKKVVKYFNPKISLCMTGTPDRMDNLNIRLLYGEEVVNITIEEGIAKGWLTPVEYHVLSDGLNKEVLKELFYDIVEKKRRITLNQINKMLFIKKRDEEQIEQIKKYTKNWTKKCIIFCESIHHVRSFARKLPKGSYKTLHSGNSRDVNNTNLKMFRNGGVNTVLAVNMFNEGIDVPDAEVIVFLRVTESGVIYRQQLGRGLRKKSGKKKVVVLDFVANTDRIMMIQGMINNIQSHLPISKRDKSLLSVAGDTYLFDFSDELKDVIEILRVARMAFYPTWQEASKAAIALGIKTWREYCVRHKEDRQLPFEPARTYADFPGFPIFLGGQAKFKTWQEASKIAIKLGMKTTGEYQSRYKEDGRLPGRPEHFYADFPGFTVFLGGQVYEKYKTWQEASKSAIKLRIKTRKEYRKKYQLDPKLPSDQSTYKEYPGDTIFFGGTPKTKFISFTKLKKEVRKKDLKSKSEYDAARKDNPAWPSEPRYTYETEWKGFPDFLGTEEKNLLPYSKLCKEVRKLGIKKPSQYYRESFKHTDWPRFPQSSWIYKKKGVWKGWEAFLGIKVVKILSFTELKKQVRAAGIRDGVHYREVYKKHPGWPSHPDDIYKKSWPGWPDFLDIYPSFVQLKKEVREKKVQTQVAYQKLQKKIPHWPANPNCLKKYEKVWPGWPKFLDKKWFKN